MQKSWVKKSLVYGIIVLFVGTSFIPGIIGTIKDENDPTIFRFVESGFNHEETESLGISSFINGVQSFSVGSDNIESNSKESNSIANVRGQILFAPIDSTITYLIDTTRMVNHTWSSSYLPGVAVYWLGNGTILRTIRVGVGPGTGGGGGGVQKVAWDGTVLWDFRYDTNGHLSHHDVKPLPNGNVLMIAWETKTRTETIAAGRNPNYVIGNEFLPDHIIEVKPTGSTSGTIVWEWHVWDHLIQDYDSSKTNYGVVGDHPELVDINLVATPIIDWMHTNSIDYNEEFDQIMISVPNFGEIWVIDHSTTTAEAASHTGGNSGKGGDLLYRWGNPAAYRAGTTNDQKWFYQHDATWIDEGCPGAGNILVFNNLGDRSSRYSSVDEIVPPVNENGEYYLKSGSSYGPATQTWIYTASPPTSFFSNHFGGAQRLTDGNTLICSGEPGTFFEVTSTGSTVWTYTNPYPLPGANNVFKIVYVPGYIPENNPPNSPSNPIPPDGTTSVSVDIELSWTGGDPDPSDNVSYDVYFGTSSSPPMFSFNQSTNTFYPGVLTKNTEYYWWIRAKDNHGSGAIGNLWSFTTTNSTNNPPNKPSTPVGKKNGKINTEYKYTSTTFDSEEDQIFYFWDWDDGNNSGWIGPYNSSSTCEAIHTWKEKGDYTIKVKAKDIHGAESLWSDPLPITMPYSYNPIHQFFEWLFERFPNAFPILRQLRGS
jgi:hypothetical protein